MSAQSERAERAAIMINDDYSDADGMTVETVRRVLRRHGVPTGEARVETCADGVVIIATEGDDAYEAQYVCATWSDVRDFLGY